MKEIGARAFLARGAGGGGPEYLDSTVVKQKHICRTLLEL